MEGIIQFMLGSVWSIFLMAGAVWGYLIFESSVKRRYDDTPPVIKSPQTGVHPEERPSQSGPVKAITPSEIKEEKDKGFINKMKSIIND